MLVQVRQRVFALVAQLDRASDYGFEGWEFESSQAQEVLFMTQKDNTNNILTNKGIMPDTRIRKCVEKYRMIDSFVESQNGGSVVSYGLSSYGYDARVADEFSIFSNVHSGVVDPKNFTKDSVVEKRTDVCLIPPNSFVLARTVEYFRIPSNVFVLCVGKSTYARCGIIVNVTPLEPGWEGYVTLEFSNTTPLPAKLYANEGACQFLFFDCDPCEVSYKSRAGKYMNQQKITYPFVKNTK